MPQPSASISSQCKCSVFCSVAANQFAGALPPCSPFPPPSAESAPGGKCCASCAGPCAPRARPFPSPRRGCERLLPHAGNTAATHPGRCGRRRAKAATCKESATLYVAKRRANKPVLPQAGSCRRGSPGSGPNQLKAGRASPAARQFERRRRVSLSRTHR